MNLLPFQDEQDIDLETATLLRVALREHAPQEVDLELGWTSVASRLTASDGKPLAGTTSRVIPSRMPHLFPRKRSWALAAVAALILALLGAGFATSFERWFPGDTGTPFAYAAINQSVQVANGIKVTAVKGYVDPKNLVLYYDVYLPANMRARYMGAFVAQSTLQGKIVQGMCEESVRDIYAPIHCLMMLPSGGDIAGNVFSVTWHISLLEFRVRDIPPPPAKHQSTSVMPFPPPVFMHGSWTLHFTMPFRHKVQDPLAVFSPATS